MPFRVYLSAAGCLDEDKWKDPELAAVLREIKEICGSLDLTPEDQVHIHAHILALDPPFLCVFVCNKIVPLFQVARDLYGSYHLPKCFHLSPRFARPWYL